MGHLLATMNPDAAAAIDNPPASPDIGTWVVFKGRSGFSRMHRTEFPALVLGEHRDGGLILMVVMEPEDMMMEDRVPFREFNQDQFYWRYRELSDHEAHAENSRVNALAAHVAELDDAIKSLVVRVAALEEDLANEDVLVPKVEALEKQVWGDYAPNDKSIFDHLAGFEAKLKASAPAAKPGKKTKGK